MKPRRPLFALDYIGETVRTYRQRLAECAAGRGDLEEILWASDVLADYFSVVGDHPVITKARRSFAEVAAEAQSLKQESAVVKAPYKRDLQRPRQIESVLAL